jgi:glycosyltransferase involved in cell wall biosynthesis
MMATSPQWICCQLGAREHYAIPRTLLRQRLLAQLVTDAWVQPANPLAAMSHSLRQRFHPDLAQAPVRAWNSSLLAFELVARLQSVSGWPLIIARNHWFQRKVASFFSLPQLSTLKSNPTLFSYSYSALEPLRFAKSRGWITVLGQIDPGPVEEEIVAAEAEREPSLARNWTRAPTDYWKSWREECDAADRIVVNSQWSFEALVQAGVQKEKLSVIPLAYEAPEVRGQESKVRGARIYPARFTPGRPMRVLFLGQINLRKGIARLLRAARAFHSQPVEFLMVGPVRINIPEDLRSKKKIRWAGPVSRNSVRSYYEQADVFILPTLSDGFALTQLEAIAYRLPVIASRRCAEVIIDHVNGLLLQEPTSAAIEEALRFCLDNPDQLARFSENATVDGRFSLSRLGENFCALAM